jgi:calcineurin-like phosphoesterase family protein
LKTHELLAQQAKPFAQFYLTGAEAASEVLFTSDTHFGHENLKYLTPARASYQDDLVNIWNNKVKPDDVVFHLGDVCWYDKSKCGLDKLINLLMSLNGYKVILLGNHDKIIIKNYEFNLPPECKILFVTQYLELNINNLPIDDWSSLNIKFAMSHFPIHSWHHKGHGTFHLYGHEHGNLISKPYDLNNPRAYDVSIDTHPKHEPYNIQELSLLFTQRELTAGK